MSHAPETSICNCNLYAEIGPTKRALNCPIHGVKAAPQTGQELTEQIRGILGIAIYNLETNEPWRKIAALIEAWVRVRELEARLDQMRAPNCSNRKCPYCEYEQDSRAVILQDLKSAIEQLKGAARGQAEAPSAAASANSEPRGA